MTSLGTYFYDTEGNRLASESGVLPIPLFKDMIITFHGKSGEYHVVDWSFHVGQRLEEAGLRIVLRHAGQQGGYEDLSPPWPYPEHESQ
jgi:hypothetical protein